MRYLSQRYSMKDDMAKALLTDIGTEELAHLKMCDNPDVTKVIRFLREREVVHFQRFGECLNKIQEDIKAKKIIGCGIKQC